MLVASWRPDRAIEVAYWYLTRRKVRARNRLYAAISDAPFAYSVLIRSIEQQEKMIDEAPRMMSGWECLPMFSIILIVPAGTPQDRFDETMRSIEAQIYDQHEVIVAGEGVTEAMRSDPRLRAVASSANNLPLLGLAIEAARGEYIVPLTPGTLLSTLGLFRFAEALQANRCATVLYGDEDSIWDKTRSRPWLKPRWNEEMILGMDYASRACIVARRTAVAVILDRGAGACRSVYALLLAITRREAAHPVHVEHITAHVPDYSNGDTASDRAAVVAEHLVDRGASVETGPFGTLSVRWPMPEAEPSVTILVPTRDRSDLVRACIESLLRKTEYSNYSIVIIDNGSVENQTKEYFRFLSDNPKIDVLSCEMPYNFSAINNYAVERTSSDYLCFLNNDTEIIDSNWLTEMMRYAVRPEIGAVGAKLLYQDLSIQHAGVVIGIGNAAGHAHRALPDGDPGYFAHAHVAHYASAVTAACLVVARHKFEQVAGFDATYLQIAYNDVDLCLKLRKAGWQNVYTPRAVLLHLESKSRGSDFLPIHRDRYMRELAVLQDRWNTTTFVDPMHHPMLDRSSETYRIAF